MDEVDMLLARAENYRMMVEFVTDDVAIHAMLAMAEDLEKRAMQLEHIQTPTD